MPHIIQTNRFRLDAERLRAFLVEQQGYEAAKKAATVIQAALKNLLTIPEGYAPTPQNPALREMGITFQSKGYKLLYQYTKSTDTIVLLAMKHQLEDDYK